MITATDEQLISLWDKLKSQAQYSSIAYQTKTGRWLYLLHHAGQLEVFLMARPPRVQAGAPPSTWLDYRAIAHTR